MHHNYWARALQLECPRAATTEPTRSGAHAPQLERENPHATTREKPMHHNEEPAHRNKKILRASMKTQCSQK